MQIPILSGIYTDNEANVRTSYPVNMIPTAEQSGISSGYLRNAPGAIRTGGGLGTPRGGVEWNGILYRVMGSKLVTVTKDGFASIIGDVGNGDRVSFAISFDYLAIASGGNLFYWDGANLTKVTDPNLGNVIDVTWIDGYFMTTDGEFLVVTELSDPFSVNPLKYGSSESDPDNVVALLKIRNEAYAINRYTIEVFGNIGGEYFPFQRISGAQILRGSVGTHAVCKASDAVAFVGGGRGEGISVWMGSNGVSARISTEEIDRLLSDLTDSQLARIVVQYRQYPGHEHIWVVLDDRTLVYDILTSKKLNSPVWFSLTSSEMGFERYRIIDPVLCYGKWNVCDSKTGDVGEMTDATARHFGSVCRWEFGTVMLYNGSKGAIINSLEMIGITGWTEIDDDPYISSSWSEDGIKWSQERFVKSGMRGEMSRRIAWLQQGKITRQRIFRFKGDSKTIISIMALEALVEALI